MYSRGRTHVILLTSYLAPPITPDNYTERRRSKSKIRKMRIMAKAGEGLEPNKTTEKSLGLF